MRISHLAIALLLGVSTRAAACEKIFLPVYRFPGDAVFIGTPQSDTLLAGPGTEKFDLNQIGAPPGTPHDVYGQLVRVDRIGSWPNAQRESLRRSGNLIVLVGWDYGADCRRVIRSGTARWMTPGKSGLFFAGVARDSAHWVGGYPTFDVDASESMPYTGDATSLRPFHRRPLAPYEAALTPDQLLELDTILPMRVRSSGPEIAEAVFKSLQKWAREYLWLGGADISRIVAVIDPHFGSRSPALALSLAAQSFARTRNFLPGRFVLTSDGRMTYDEPAKRGSTTVVTIHGERISNTSLSHVP